MKKQLPSSIVIYGRTMTFAGFGCYPYDCQAKDKWPNAAIYQNIQERTWTHEHAFDFKFRNELNDNYNPILLECSFTSAPLYKVCDTELNRKYHPELVGKYLTHTVPYCTVKVI